VVVVVFVVVVVGGGGGGADTTRCRGVGDFLYIAPSPGFSLLERTLRQLCDADAAHLRLRLRPAGPERELRLRPGRGEPRRRVARRGLLARLEISGNFRKFPLPQISKLISTAVIIRGARHLLERRM